MEATLTGSPGRTVSERTLLLTASHVAKGNSHACLSRSSKDERKCAQCLGLADAQDLGEISKS